MNAASVFAALDLLPCPAAVLDASGRFVHANPPWCDTVGRECSALLGRAPRSDVDPAELNDGVPREIVFDHDGQTRAVTAAGRLLDAGELAAHRVLVFLDTTAQHELLTTVSRLSDQAVATALESRELNDELEKRVRQRTAELHDANVDALTMLAVASEARDTDTGAHVRRIERMARDTALALGLPDDFAEHLGRSAILHDVGKITVPDGILKKPGRLTDAERTAMQKHTVEGQRILGTNPFFDLARVIARSHHENHDGTGYPDRLAGDAVPLPARIVHVVDVFDALASPRVYKDAWPPDRVVETLRTERGTSFDPAVVDAFLGTLDAVGAG